MNIAIFNMKGGVGKSTTTYNLAVGLVRQGKQVLVVDIDPQGNSSVALGIDIGSLEKQIKDVLLDGLDVSEAIQSGKEGVDVLPSNIFLAESEIPISGIAGRELLLRRALKPVVQSYDYLLIDCPPNIGVFSINALMASQQLIIPVDMSYLGLMGINAVERSMQLVRDRLEHPVEIMGVLGTRYDARNNLSKTVLERLTEHFGQKMFSTVIPETVKLREAPSHSASIFDYDPRGAGAKAYLSLVEEVEQRRGVRA